MKKRPIGMFDSGVGGLTVYKEIKHTFPNEKIIYLGDTKRFPYGTKTKDSIIEISKNCIEFLISQNVKLIIIACGTATSLALDTLKDLYDIPIIGIIDPTVAYIKDNNYKNIGVIATRGTINSNAWELKLKHIIDDINVQNKACPLLAPLAEEGWTNNIIAKLTIKKYLKSFNKIDALILGCTHYPMFERLIKEELPNTTIINTGTIIASYLKDILPTNSSKQEQEDIFFLTDKEGNFIKLAEKILNKKIKINLIEI
ncbi:MAG: glutamate racemase [Bacilli bacterium]|nr:glutamate racemase [Bacilli bacterium]